MQRISEGVERVGEKISLREKIIFGVLVVLLITGGIWRADHLNKSSSQIIEVSNHQQEDLQLVPELITVHLVGAVNNPDVYTLPVGSRVYELLELCGGFSSEADYEAINLARPLMDGEQVYVQKIGEASAQTVTEGAGKININQAGVNDLTALPGIGEVRAGQIIAHREKNGFFKDIREIMDVSGIGEKTFENIADLITVY